MGKVYDALRRAEEQRARRATEAPALAPAVAAEPVAPELPTPAPGIPAAPSLPGRGPAPLREPARRLPFWKRLLGGRRARLAEETAGALNKRRICQLQPESFVAEQFRSLRGRIDSIASQQPLASIAVTSSLSSEGKTTAATNLALVTSMSVGRRVLLVDCDLRRPHVHQSLGLRVEAGLAEVLTGQATLEDAIIRVEGTSLDVLPVRSLPPNPSELLASQRMQRLVEELVGRYDRLILDVPPALGMPDAKTLCDLCDGIVFVVRADQTPSVDVQQALEVLDRRRLLGLVLNGVETDPTRYGYASY